MRGVGTGTDIFTSRISAGTASASACSLSNQNNPVASTRSLPRRVSPQQRVPDHAVLRLSRCRAVPARSIGESQPPTAIQAASPRPAISPTNAASPHSSTRTSALRRAGRALAGLPFACFGRVDCV